jgi:ribosomal protein S18 acetylase RimI-like enzyme
MAEPTPTMRKARPEDREFAYRVREASFRDYVEKVEGWDEVEQRRLHERRFAAQDFRIVSVAGTDVGVVAMVVTPDCLKVNQLLVLPEHQGRAIGRHCMLALMDEARRLGVPVRLRVMKVNPRACAFYERLGFRRTGETETHDLMELT